MLATRRLQLLSMIVGGIMLLALAVLLLCLGSRDKEKLARQLFPPPLTPQTPICALSSRRARDGL